MPELETLLRDARPDWPEPSVAAEARARAALGFTHAPRSPRGRLSRTARARGARLLIPAALLLTAGAAVAATLISPGSSGTPAGRPASVDFGPREVIGAPASLIDGPPALAVDRQGTVTAVWARAGRVVASTRARGGAWSAAERLSGPGVRASYPRVVAEADGAVTVIWRERTAGTRVEERFTLPDGSPGGALSELTGRRWAVVARTRPAGGAWAPAQPVSPETAAVRDMEEPGLAATAGGGAVATWDRGGAVWASRRSPDGGWSAPVQVGAAGGEAVDPRLAASTGGRALLVWSNRVGLGIDRRYEIRASVMDGDGSWSAPRELSTALRNPPHAIGAVNASGAALVSWRRDGDGLTGGQGLVASRDAQGDWSPGEPVGRPSKGAFGTSLLVELAPETTAVALDAATGSAFRRAPGGEWAPLALAPARGRVFGATMASDATGTPVIARAVFDERAQVVERVGGATDRVRGIGSNTVLAAGADGTTAIAWIGARPVVVAAVAEAGP